MDGEISANYLEIKFHLAKIRASKVRVYVISHSDIKNLTLLAQGASIADIGHIQ